MTADQLAAARQKIRDADLDAAKKRLESFVAEGPTFDGDLKTVNPKFTKWLAAQDQSVVDSLKLFYAAEIVSNEDISHNHPGGNGAHARRTLLLRYAADTHGYDL